MIGQIKYAEIRLLDIGSVLLRGHLLWLLKAHRYVVGDAIGICRRPGVGLRTQKGSSSNLDLSLSLI
jgi:hypothetical protein